MREIVTFVAVLMIINTSILDASVDAAYRRSAGIDTG